MYRERRCSAKHANERGGARVNTARGSAPFSRCPVQRTAAPRLRRAWPWRTAATRAWRGACDRGSRAGWQRADSAALRFRRRWLSKAGLSRYIPRFVAEGIDDEAFKQLLMQARRRAARRGAAR